jgi:cyclohexadieny/prephenate dehydrogenase
MKKISKMAIIAPGLLGASLGASAKRLELVEFVSVWARRESVRISCRDLPWCDECPETLSETVADAELVWICSPVTTIAPLVGKISPHLKPGAVVSDVGSTKLKVVERCKLAIGNHAPFIGSHPMAGSEKSGHEAADAFLFQDRPCIVTPLGDECPDSLAKVVGFWKNLGMKVHQMSPEAHDKVVACISHLPHLTAVILSSVVARESKGQWNDYVGTGLLDTTRVASGSPGMWQAIVQDNREAIIPLLKAVANEIDHVRIHLEEGRLESLIEVLESGKQFRDSIARLSE